MPTLIHSSQIQLEWKDILGRVKHPKPKHSEKRSAGVHLSGVLKHIATSLRMFKELEELEAEEMPLRMAVGMAWEDWAVGLWPEMVWQPGERKRDGISGTPDGYSAVEDGDFAVLQLEEFKATWKSKRTRKDILAEKIWMWQMAGYIAMSKVEETRCYLFRRARLHVLWINGEYPRGAPSPEYWTYTIEFSAEELEGFWKNLVLTNVGGAKEEEGG